MKTYEKINETILQLIEQNKTLPWRKPWRGSLPAQNYLTKKPYQGINWLILNSCSYSSPYFLTYKQAQELGGQVIKGSKGLPCVYYSIIESKTETTKNGDAKIIPFAKYSTVFNASQIEGIDFEQPYKQASEFSPIEKAEKVIEAMQNKPVIVHEQQQAYYMPTTDKINMPQKTSFDSSENYYATLFHELGHSTGHASRLNRKGIVELNRFGSHEYSFEELVAELASAYTCGHCEIDNTIEQSAAYIQGWSLKLQNNPEWFLKAASQASKAFKYITNQAE